MKDLILVYTTWESLEEAKKAGKHLLKKRLCGCVNIFPDVQPIYWWPPKENKLDESKEVVMIIKTLKSEYRKVEKEIKKVTSSEVPCIITLPVYGVNREYYDWIKGEIEFKK